MKKKIFAVAVAGTLLSVCLAGCTNGNVQVATSEDVANQIMSEIESEVESEINEALPETSEG